MPDNDRIITSIAVQKTPKIQDSDIVKTFLSSTREADTNRYWADVDNQNIRRRVFPIEYWQLDRLIKKTGLVALTVKYINNPKKVTAKWASYNPEKPPVLTEYSRCFVLSKSFYNGIIEIQSLGTVSHFVRGLEIVHVHGKETNFLLAILGKNEAGEYNLYLQNASANPIEGDPNEGFNPTPGGEGAGGVKLPV